MQLFLGGLFLAAGGATLAWFVIYASLLLEMHRQARQQDYVPRDPVIANTMMAWKLAFPAVMSLIIGSVFWAFK